MRSLYLRIYLTVVAALALFALVSVWLAQSRLDQERARWDSSARERAGAWAELLQRTLPGPEAPRDEQAAALREWSMRLRVPLALDDAAGRRIGASEVYQRREAEFGALVQRRSTPIRFDDGRTLWVLRPGARVGGAPPQMTQMSQMSQMSPWWAPRGGDDGIRFAVLLVVLFAAVAAGAYPVVRRLTRRLEALKRGVEAFGAGALRERVAEDGRDEIAALGASFNRAAARIEALLETHKSLLANASHELRSPLTRLKMAVSMLEDAPPEQRKALRREIDANIGELDALVEEVLMAGRLDAASALEQRAEVELLAIAAEEAARVQASAQGTPAVVNGDERLIRRALRNLLENARRYGGNEVEVTVSARGGVAEASVCDRGPGVPAAYRERIFEPFFRLPGHAEKAGGVGLGLALVRQIAERHGGQVRCEAREGGGSRFTLVLPQRA